MNPSSQREKAAELVTKVCGSMDDTGMAELVDAFGLTNAIAEALADERKAAIEEAAEAAERHLRLGVVVVALPAVIRALAAKDPERCKHDIHGEDCKECYP